MTALCIFETSMIPLFLSFFFTLSRTHRDGAAQEGREERPVGKAEVPLVRYVGADAHCIVVLPPERASRRMVSAHNEAPSILSRHKGRLAVDLENEPNSPVGGLNLGHHAPALAHLVGLRVARPRAAAPARPNVPRRGVVELEAVHGGPKGLEELHHLSPGRRASRRESRQTGEERGESEGRAHCAARRV